MTTTKDPLSTMTNPTLTSRLLMALLMASTLITGRTSIAVAQETDCPSGFPAEATCHTPEPFECLSADALVGHQREIAACRQTADELRGRLEECRDQVVPLQRRVEEQSAEKADLRRQRDSARMDLEQRRSPWSWLSFGLCAGAGAAGGVQLGTADGPTDVVRGGVTLGVGLVGCGIGLLID